MPTELPAGAGSAAMAFVEDLGAPELSSEDRHHLFDVLRLAPGETVVVSDGRGAWATAPVVAGGLGPIGETRRVPRQDPGIVVAFAPVKGDRTPWLVAKLTELGVDRIVPITTARSVVRWEGDRGERAVAKLARTAREAAAQSRRAHLPEIGPPTTLAGLAEHGTVHLAVPGARPPTWPPAGGGGASMVVAVGPEGGWSPDEVESALPERRIGLGPTILRAETAAVAVAGLLCALRAGVVAPVDH